ncbi:MAG: prolipoprotein diacylglyceryl transferase [Gemmatimonadetes bacterium]|nr:prolipoprotein diacylglyceryl transferase [Gemmatimonadota bacterium]
MGLVIGRLGCQLSGTWDQTYGNPTGMAWGWNYGDGVLRHPVALYELATVSLLFVLLRRRWPETPGARFAAFLAGYAALRFGLEFLKPPYGALAEGTLPSDWYAGLTAIQWTAIAGVVWFGALWRMRRRGGDLASTDRATAA